LNATWSGSAAAPLVHVDAADADKLHDCSGWTLTVDTPSDATPSSAACGEVDGAAPPQDVALTCSDPPPSDGWSVSIGYTDLSGSAQTATVPVTGSPPS